MQGQRSAISSLPEALDIDHPSSSSSSSNGMNSHQLCWNTIQNSSESQISQSMVPPSDHMAFLNSVSHERQNLLGSGIPERGSSSSYHEAGSIEWKAEHGWLSSAGFSGGSGPLIEDQQRSANNRRFVLDDVSVNPLMIHSSRSSWTGQNLNLNAGHGSDSSFSESPNLYSLTGLNDQQLPPSGCSDPFMIPPGTGKCIVGENDGGQGGSLDVRHIPCKRKSLERHVGQSSIGESSHFLEVEETSAQHATSAHSNMNTNSTMSRVSEQADPQLGSSVSHVTGIVSPCPPYTSVSESAETSQRSSRLRINSSMHSYPNSSIIHPMGGALSNSNVSSTSQSSRFVSVSHSLDLPLAPASSNVNIQEQPDLLDLPSLPYPEQSIRWSRGSVTRPGSSSSSAFYRNRDDELQEASLGRYSRNVGRHPMYIPASELRNLVQGPVSRDIPGGSSAIPRSTTYSTQAGSSTSVPQSSQPNSVPHRSRHSHYPRRCPDYVRRSLLASIGSEMDPSSHSSDYSDHPAFLQDVLSSGSRNQGHRRSFPRSASWMERHGDALGIPYSMRTLAAASEGRRRLVSEIRSVLDHMRQGEGLRPEDVMILDQSVFLGVADIHDRHGDMRLDVDNMSYEELLALEERIGNVNTGLSEETILSRMKQRKYTVVVCMDVEAEPCCICQELYNEGEGVGTLECGHDFHTNCIKQWLMHKNLCPICKTTGLTT
ncbi:probable E3 ubiquitin-protein ligase RHG1A isoform X1 [Eucalyptus grandis]|uniref:probable E3 ubiquitin-protein ligase RHG1A isoform X1 n=1 Tax=Eucalyptus grandis TaxID=71139 RepID=UPI00192EA41D|nr:probable E3 ubiquitin-protein ligase RHG1A isoform X1 [Eucalyptus grandis]